MGAINKAYFLSLMLQHNTKEYQTFIHVISLLCCCCKTLKNNKINETIAIEAINAKSVTPVTPQSPQTDKSDVESQLSHSDIVSADFVEEPSKL